MSDADSKTTAKLELEERGVAVEQQQHLESNHHNNSSSNNETSKEVRLLVNQQKSLLSDDNIEKHNMEVDNYPKASHIQAEASSNLHQDVIDPKDDEPHQLKTTLFASTSGREVPPRNQVENTSVASKSNETSSNQSPFEWSSTAPPLPPSERTQASLEAWRLLEQELERFLSLDQSQDDNTHSQARYLDPSFGPSSQMLDLFSIHDGLPLEHAPRPVQSRSQESPRMLEREHVAGEDDENEVEDRK